MNVDTKDTKVYAGMVENALNQEQWPKLLIICTKIMACVPGVNFQPCGKSTFPRGHSIFSLNYKTNYTLHAYKFFTVNKKKRQRLNV